MPECTNCGGHVTENYVRVFTPEEHDAPRACPNCEDKIREKGGIRERKT